MIITKYSGRPEARYVHKTKHVKIPLGGKQQKLNINSDMSK
jgi:hypothetical protein